MGCSECERECEAKINSGYSLISVSEKFYFLNNIIGFTRQGSQQHVFIFRQISIDVPRMSPLVGLFQQRCVQEMVERVLYIWAIRYQVIIV